MSVTQSTIHYLKEKLHQEERWLETNKKQLVELSKSVTDNERAIKEFSEMIALLEAREKNGNGR